MKHKKFNVVAVIREPEGVRYIPLRECEDYEAAYVAREEYKARNAGVTFLVEHVLKDDAPPTVFDRITASPAELAKLLRSLPVVSGPWDEAFNRVYCAGCGATDCDECRLEARNNPLWWLGLPAEVAE